MKLINKRELHKRIVAYPSNAGRYGVRHDIPGETQVIIEVPTLEIAGCIVKALRERAQLKLAEQLLAEHMVRRRRRIP